MSSFSLKEEHRLKAFGSRTVFGPKGEEETGDWRRLHNEKLHKM
jgi:hypothetical protein